MVQAKNSLLFCLTKTNYVLQLFLALKDIHNKRNRILFFLISVNWPQQCVIMHTQVQINILLHENIVLAFHVRVSFKPTEKRMRKFVLNICFLLVWAVLQYLYQYIFSNVVFIFILTPQEGPQSTYWPLRIPFHYIDLPLDIWPNMRR